MLCIPFVLKAKCVTEQSVQLQQHVASAAVAKGKQAKPML